MKLLSSWSLLIIILHNVSSSVTQNTLKNISPPSVYVNSQKKNYLSWPFTTSKSFTHYILILCISEYAWYVSKDESLNELWSKMLSFNKQGLAMKPLVKKNKAPKGRRQSATTGTAMNVLLDFIPSIPIVMLRLTEHACFFY